MGKTVAELNASLTVDELTDWIAFDREYPISFGVVELDAFFARLSLHICEVAGAKKKGGGRLSVDDFLIFKPKPKTPMEFMRSRFGHMVRKR